MKAVGRKSFISAFAIVGGLTPISLLTSCGNAQTIQFANFESYMDSDLIKDLESNYNIQFPYYTVTENIETKFQRYYDVAIPSCYEMFTLLKRGWLTPIEWDRFEITGVTDAETAKTLFNEKIINDINNQFQEFVFGTEQGEEYRKYFPDEQVNVLIYGVPYFAQSFSFAYKADQAITFYQYNEPHEATDSPNWEDIYYTVANNDYFYRSAGHSVSMLDDSKSIYDIARICETNLEDGDPTNLVPNVSSKPRMLKTFDAITKPSEGKPSKYIVNTDSGVISKLFADPRGSAAAFTWSGDTIYAAKGAEEYKPIIDKFHLQSASNVSLDEVDFIVINNKNNKDDFIKKKEDIYNVIKQVCFDGINDPTNIGQYDEQKQRYKYWSMQNFDTLNYTPVLNITYDEVTNEDSTYWENEGDSESTIKIYIQILQQVTRDVKHLYGRTITPEQNSDIHWAWMEAKGKF